MGTAPEAHPRHKLETTMLTFVDGPAAGKTIGLRRAPRFLRITRRRFLLGMEDPGEEFDGLDQPGDIARHDESLYAYETKKLEGRAHMRFSGKAKSASGIYDIAEYRFIEPQPADDIMRDNKKWIAWCERQPPIPK
jgi:hypothetical protein